MKSLVILQARMSSSRFPGKTMKVINDHPMIFWQIRRILTSTIDELIVATSDDESDDELANYLKSINVSIYRGSLDDVYSRFIHSMTALNPDIVIRLTGDCPLVMPQLIDEMLRYFCATNLDYLSNTNPPTFPDGLDIEIVKPDALRKLGNWTLTREEKEHVTMGIYSRPEQFKLGNYTSPVDLSNLRWTVDYEEDFNYISKIFEYFSGSEEHFTISEVLDVLDKGIISANPIPGEYRNISLRREPTGD